MCVFNVILFNNVMVKFHNNFTAQKMENTVSSGKYCLRQRRDYYLRIKHNLIEISSSRIKTIFIIFIFYWRFGHIDFLQK